MYKEIKGYEGLYEVNIIGDVRNVKRGTFLKSHLHRVKDGYLKVILYKDGRLFNHLVHILVADAFIPNPDNLPVINHKDRNKLNNYVDNLERCTHEYNIKHGYFYTMLERNKLSYVDVLEIQNLLTQGKSWTKISEWFDVPEKTIRRVMESDILKEVF